MSQLSEDAIQDITEVFGLFDNRGDGKIAASQLGDCLRSLGQNPSEAEIRKCGYAGNPDARISFEVFLPILQTISRNKEPNRPDEFIEGFRMFDKEQNGYITSAELRHILTCLGDKMTDEEVDQVIQGQEDPQGNINYEEFVKCVLQG